MSVRIFKWEIQPERRQLLKVPQGTKFLTVDKQYDLLVLWGEAPQPVFGYEDRVLVVVTTGDEFESVGKTYIGSAILGKQGEGEWYVSHVYEQHRGAHDPIDHRNDEDRATILARDLL
jgi:hypothetical protein